MEVQVKYKEYASYEDRRYAVDRALSKFRTQSAEIVAECRHRKTHKTKNQKRLHKERQNHKARKAARHQSHH